MFRNSTRAATVRKRGTLSIVRTPVRSLTVAALAGLAGCGAKEEPPAAPPVSVAESNGPGGRASRTTDATPVASASSAESAPPGDADLIARFAGTYTRESYGHRTMVVREDGTATMTVDVDPWYQAIAGKRIAVEIAWELTGEAGSEEKRGVHFESVSGTPESSFKAVTKLFGTEADWTIEAADDDKLVLYDPEDEETVEWVRVKDPAG